MPVSHGSYLPDRQAPRKRLKIRFTPRVKCVLSYLFGMHTVITLQRPLPNFAQVLARHLHHKEYMEYAVIIYSIDIFLHRLDSAKILDPAIQ